MLRGRESLDALFGGCSSGRLLFGGLWEERFFQLWVFRAAVVILAPQSGEVLYMKGSMAPASPPIVEAVATRRREIVCGLKLQRHRSRLVVYRCGLSACSVTRPGSFFPYIRRVEVLSIHDETGRFLLPGCGLFL